MCGLTTIAHAAVCARASSSHIRQSVVRARGCVPSGGAGCRFVEGGVARDEGYARPLPGVDAGEPAGPEIFSDNTRGIAVCESTPRPLRVESRGSDPILTDNTQGLSVCESRICLLHHLLSQRTARSVLSGGQTPSLGAEYRRAKLRLTRDAAGGRPTSSRRPRRTVAGPRGGRERRRRRTWAILDVAGDGGWLGPNGSGGG